MRRNVTDIIADPFHERVAPASRTRMTFLGVRFEFECASAELRHLVDWAYAGLPAHKLGATMPRFHIKVAHAPQTDARSRAAPRPIDLLAGAGMLCGTTSIADFTVIAPDYKGALVVASRSMLRFPYNTRYELLEFAVFMLASRGRGLIPLHGACVGENGRGVLLMGDTGAGKSTVSLHCGLRGMEFISEDGVFVTPDARLATGVANFLHIRCDSLQTLPKAAAASIRRAPVIRRRSGVQKFEVDLRQPPFRPAARPLELAGLIFLSKQPAGRERLLSQLRPREALSRLRATQPYAASQPDWALFSNRVRSTPTFELRRGKHPDAAVDALRELLQ